MPKKQSWYSIEAKEGSTEADVIIYDEIGTFGVSAKDFINEVKPLAVDTINLRLNTPGGSVADGTAMFNVLKEHSARVIAHVDGIAASIGSFVAMAADEVRMAANTFMMIHDPTGLAIGGAEQMEKMADVLNRMAGSMATAYAAKSGQTVEAVRSMMAAETWFTGQEAVDAGFADTVTGDVEVTAHFDLSNYQKTPKAITDHFAQDSPSIRELEHALRDAGGLSTVDAKTVLAKGYDALAQRDAAAAAQRDVGDKKNKSITKEAEVENIKELKAQHRDLYDEVFALGAGSVDIDDAVAKAMQVEAKRVEDVRAVLMPGFETEIEAMATDGKTSGAQAALALNGLQRKQMDAEAAKIAKDAKGVKVPEASTAAAGAGTELKDDFESLVTACMKDDKLTRAKAISKVAKDHPKAHAAYVEGLRNPEKKEAA